MGEAPRRSLLFLGVVVCIAAYPLAVRYAPRKDAITAAAGTNGVTLVRLPDGSRATLMSGSRIRYRPDFARRRVIWLSGQAALEIISGSDFTVWTETARMKSLGGSFIVRNVGLDTTFVSVRRGTANLRAFNEDNDPAYRSVIVGTGQRAFAAKMVGAKLIPP